VFFPTISASDQVSPVSIEISTLASSRSSVQAASNDVGLTRWNGLLEYEDEPWNTSASSQAADDEFAKKRDPKSANNHKLGAIINRLFIVDSHRCDSESVIEIK
jgi:hypothetical protein